MWYLRFGFVCGGGTTRGTRGGSGVGGVSHRSYRCADAADARARCDVSVDDDFALAAALAAGAAGVSAHGPALAAASSP